MLNIHICVRHDSCIEKRKSNFNLRKSRNYGTNTVTPRNLYRYKLGKIIMTGICIGISYGK